MLNAVSPSKKPQKLKPPSNINSPPFPSPFTSATLQARDAALSETTRKRDVARRAVQDAEGRAADKERLQSENNVLLARLEEVRTKVVVVVR